MIWNKKRYWYKVMYHSNRKNGWIKEYRWWRFKQKWCWTTMMITVQDLYKFTIMILTVRKELLIRFVKEGIMMMRLKRKNHLMIMTMMMNKMTINNKRIWGRIKNEKKSYWCYIIVFTIRKHSNRSFLFLILYRICMYVCIIVLK